MYLLSSDFRAIRRLNDGDEVTEAGCLVFDTIEELQTERVSLLFSKIGVLEHESDMLTMELGCAETQVMNEGMHHSATLQDMVSLQKAYVDLMCDHKDTMDRLARSMAQTDRALALIKRWTSLDKD